MTIADPGQVAVHVAITRNPGPAAILDFNWPISPAPPTYVPLGLPTTPWAPVLDVLAGLTGLLAVAWVLTSMVRNRHRTRTSLAAGT